MSTAKDEAEIGRTEPPSDEEDGGERLEEEDQDEPLKRLSGLAPVGVEGRDDDEYSLSAESGGPRVRNNHRSSLLKKHDLESSPGRGRPSSADGSLSIPDDTPSIQVRDIS